MVVKADDYFLNTDFYNALTMYEKALKQDTIYRNAILDFRKNNIKICKLILDANRLSEKQEYEGAIKNYYKADSITTDENIHNYLREKSREIEKYVDNDWIGVWEQKKSGKQGEINGFIFFKKLRNNQKYYVNKFANGVIQHGILSNIQFEKNGNVMKGFWDNIDTKQTGQFEFEIDATYRSFTGKYSMKRNESPTYYWNGEKNKKTP